MAISKLQLVEIEFPETMSDEILSKLVDSEEFHPEPASKFVDSVRGLKVMNKDNPYADLLGRMKRQRSMVLISIHQKSLRSSILQKQMITSANVLMKQTKSHVLKMNYR